MSGAESPRPPVREPPPPKPRRFYATATIGDGPPWSVLLDGKPVRTPLKKSLATQKRALAEAIAAEWDAQREVIAFEAMPLTRLMSTALDRIALARRDVTAELLKHVDADLLCYRATHPPELRHRQTVIWQPVLDWLDATHGIAMASVEGLMPAEQPPDVHKGLADVLAALDDLSLTAVQAAAAATGSLALGLAMAGRRLSGPEAFAASQLDETFQMEKWGEDSLATQRRASIAADLDGIARFVELLSA